MKTRRSDPRAPLLAGMALLWLCAASTVASATDTQTLDREATATLDALYAKNPGAKALAKEAKAILVFPKIIKAGLVFGGSYGEGVLFEGGAVSGYYNSVSAAWGWQAGAESYAYVLFLVTDGAVEYLARSDGWEIGAGPNVVVADSGMAANLSTTTLKDDAYAFITDQQGLMASLSIEGTKITKIEHP